MENRYKVTRNCCDCHPETCCHRKYIIMDTVINMVIGNGFDSYNACKEQAQFFNEIEKELVEEITHNAKYNRPVHDAFAGC